MDIPYFNQFRDYWDMDHYQGALEISKAIMDNDLLNEKVLGYEYVPSYLLPRFGPLKLVFKTGSNKYPDWTMPPEIIPAVREELVTYKKDHKKERNKSHL